MPVMGLPARKFETHYTYKDYRQWGDDERWELINGVAYNMSPAPRVRHQDILGRLHLRIAAHLVGKPCWVMIAPTDVFLPRFHQMDEDDVDSVVQPDLLVVCDPTKIRSNGIWGPPDLVVEILSPSTSRKDQHEKYDLYERSGVREYWVLEPNGRWLQQYVRGEDGRFGIEITFETNGTLTSPVLAELALDVSAIWSDLP